MGHAYSGRQCGVRHLARTARPGAGDAGRQHPRLQQRSRGTGGGAPVQLRRGLPAALCRPRRRGRADPGQSRIYARSSSSRRRCRSTIRARSARWGSRTASTSSAATAWASRMPGTRSASAARWAAIRPREALRTRLDRHLLQLRQFHDDHRHLSADGGLGDDDADLQRQGRLHPLRGAGIRLRTGQRRAQQGGGAVCGAGRLLRARCELHQAGGRLRGRALEEQAHARGRPCRRDGGRQRRCRRQGTLVHGEVRRGRHFHAGQAGLLRQGARW